MKYLIVAVLGLICNTLNAQSDQELVERTCMNYIEGFYEGDTTKLIKSLSKKLHKFGFYRDDQAEMQNAGLMSFEDALVYADNVRQNGNKRVNGAIKKVEVLDISTKTAAAKVYAWWGIDYIHLVKNNDNWIIEQVLWQSADAIPVKKNISADSFYYQIPDYPVRYTSYSVAARVIDGLGFRYYWATKGLTEENLIFQPGEDSRSIGETLNHIYNLAEVVLHTVRGEPLVRPSVAPILEKFEDKRSRTLEMIMEASRTLHSFDRKTIEDMDMIFKRGEKVSAFPFWNMLNGPLADAIWHVGQVVSYRRLAGNPFDNKANVLTGKRRN